MPGDELVVQEVPVSETPVVPETKESKPAAEAKPQTPEVPPTVDGLAKQISTLQKSIEEQREESRRVLQSTRDRADAQIQALARKARAAEETLIAAQRELAETDPGMARDLELAAARAKDSQAQKEAAENAVLAQQQAFHNQFMQTLTDAVKEMGVDPNDKNLDRGEGAKSYWEIQKRVLSSAAKIQKANVETAQSAQLKALQEQIRELKGEANSVDTSNPAGGSSLSDKDFIAKFANGDIPMNKKNMDRYHKIVGL